MLDGESLRLLERLLKPLEKQLDEHKLLLENIHDEVRRTNGRVTDHDVRLQSLEIAQDSERTRRVRRGDRRRAWLELLVGGVFVFMAGTEGAHVIHLLGRVF